LGGVEETVATAFAAKASLPSRLHLLPGDKQCDRWPLFLIRGDLTLPAHPLPLTGDLGARLPIAAVQIQLRSQVLPTLV
jgi:hypothetical protein